MKKYFIDNEEVEVEEFEDRLEDDVNLQCEEGLDDWLDEIDEPIRIGSLEYAPSDVLKNVDPIAYRCSLSDYESFTLEDVNDELDHLEEVEVNHSFYRIEEDE